MNRQILFRGLTASNQWVEGDLLQIKEGVFIAHYNRLEYLEHKIKPESIGQFTGLHDKHGKRIFEGMKMKCSWLAELGITEFDCEAIGTVVYQPAIAAYVLEFDKPYHTGIDIGGDSGIYEVEQMQLREYDEDETIYFEIIETPELLQP